MSLVAGSWLFHDDDDDYANLWQLGLFAKIARCVSKFISRNDNVAMFSLLEPIKIFLLIGPPGAMCAQFRLIMKYVAGLRWSTGARRIARIKYANSFQFDDCTTSTGLL